MPPCAQYDIDGDGILDDVTPEIDPGQGEDEADGPPPSVNVTIPPPNRFDNDVAWTPSVAVVGDVETARAKAASAHDALEASIALVRSFRLQLKSGRAQRDLLDADTQANLEALEAAEQRLRFRATDAFVEGEAPTLEAAIGYDESLDSIAQQTVVELVFETDRATIAAYLATKADLENETTRLRERIKLLERSLVTAEETVVTNRDAVVQAEAELEAFEAGSGVYIPGVTFPIVWPYSVPLINSWGFPRSGGRRHEGIDIFAPAGTPLVAAERGIVTKIGNGTLGGLRLWLRGESGTDWYYAHLSAFADGLSENQVVEVGELIGYVGNTGNAVGTPPHLHMQIHPNGGDPVNPYHLLKLVSDRELAARADAE